MNLKQTLLIGALAALPIAPTFAADPMPPPSEEGSDRQAERELERELAEARRALAEAARRVAEVSAREAERFVREMEFEWVAAPRVRLGVIIDGDDDHSAGVAISQVSEGGPAAQAGLQPGDVMLEVNGQSMAATEERRRPPVLRVREALAEVEPGAEVAIRYRRGNRTRNAEVTVVAAPEAPRAPREFVFGMGDAPRTLVEIPGIPPLPAIALRPLGDYEFVSVDADLGRYFGTERGLLVVRTGDENPLGLRPGDVILNIGGREPSSPTQAARILRSYEPGETIELDIMRDRERMRLSVEVPEPVRTSWLRD